MGSDAREPLGMNGCALGAVESTRGGRLCGVTDAVGSITKGISSLCPAGALLWRLKNNKKKRK